MKRLLIDINSVIPYFMYGHTTGLGRSTLELVNAFSEIGKFPFELMLYSQNLKGIRAKGHIPLKEFHLFLPNKPFVRRMVNALHLKTFLTHYDLLHIPHNIDYCETYSKTVFTIHDLIVYHYPEMWAATELELDRFRVIGQRCKAIVTCSESSKNDIIRFWDVPDDKIFVIPWGVNRTIFRPVENESLLKRWDINRPYFFSSSCNHTRKNTPLILKAYEMYRAKGGTHQLVLLNPDGNELKGYADMVERKDVIVCRDVTDEELVTLYAHAHASVIVSSYEGFGFPVLESLACGTQVVAARNSSLVEAGGHVVSYIDQLEAETLCAKLMELSGVEKCQMMDSLAVKSHLDHFSWQKCAEAYIGVYEKLLYTT